MANKNIKTINVPFEHTIDTDVDIPLDVIIEALDDEDMQNIAGLTGYVDGEPLQYAAKHAIEMIRNEDYDGAILTLERMFFPKFVSKIAAMEKYNEAMEKK